MCEFYRAPSDEIKSPRAKTIKLANGVSIYYKEAGIHDDGHSLLLLHGFPTSSNYFRTLIPQLASNSCYVVAPDLPGFGASVTPDGYKFTFQKLAETLVLLVDALSMNSNLSLYCHGEYGLQVGLKLISYKSESIASVIVQNATLSIEARANSHALDVFNTGLSPVTAATASSAIMSRSTSSISLNSDGIYALKSCISLRSESGSPQAALSTLTPKQRVSFGEVVEEMHTKTIYPSAVVRDTADSLHSSSSEADEFEEMDESCSSDDSGTTDTSLSSNIDKDIPLSALDMIHLPNSDLKREDEDELSLDKIHRLYSTKCKIPLDTHSYLFDYFLLTRHNQFYIQHQLYRDYTMQQSPLPAVQLWLRTTNTPFLILWGTSDLIISQDVSLAVFKRECRKCDIKTYQDGGHFALEYYSDEIAKDINTFIEEKIKL